LCIEVFLWAAMIINLSKKVHGFETKSYLYKIKDFRTQKTHKYKNVNRIKNDMQKKQVGKMYKRSDIFILLIGVSLLLFRM